MWDTGKSMDLFSGYLRRMATMKVLIDATTALGQTGVGIAGRNLINALFSMDTGVEFTLLFMGNVSQCPETWHKKACVVGTDKPWMRKIVCGPGSLLSVFWPPWWPGDFDVYHSLESFLPVRHADRGVVTVHDHPDFLCSGGSFREHCIRRALRRSAHVITVSDYVRKGVLAVTGRSPNEVTTIRNAVEVIDRVGKPPKGLGNITEAFLLYVGGLHLGKRNLVGMAKAYSKLRKEHAVKHILVVAGPIERYFEESWTAIVAAADGEPVIHLGYVNHSEIRYLYEHATMLVFPSFFEGLPLPLLESMSVGCPIITSTIEPCKEAVGDAALLVDPADVEGMTQAMRKLIENENLRSELVHKGLKQTASWTWEQAAKATQDVYKKVGA